MFDRIFVFLLTSVSDEYFFHPGVAMLPLRLISEKLITALHSFMTVSPYILLVQLTGTTYYLTLLGTYWYNIVKSSILC